MTNEELILKKLEKLDRLEEQLAPIVSAHNARAELVADLAPLGKEAAAMVTKGLQEVESRFELQDAQELLKMVVRNTRNFTYALRQFESLIDFLKDLEPLMKSTVPMLISYLDALEQKGVFRILKIWIVDFREKIADNYGPEESEAIIEGIVAIIGLAQSLADPRAVEFLNRLAALPSLVDLDAAPKVGPAGLAMATMNAEMKEGLGVLVELTKALGKLKEEGH
ncbi:MAG: DUF1641 domain-containing protein [Desulfobacterales bacterium]|nr:DUF1641 domain-containing protein [Desulfobacterales bacterium]